LDTRTKWINSVWPALINAKPNHLGGHFKQVILKHMKFTLFIIVILLLNSCNQNAEKRNVSLKYNLRIYCQNELILLVDPLNNWQIPIDSIISFKDYFSRSLVQERKHPSDFEHSWNILSDSIEKTNNLDSARAIYNKIHPLVFPFINVDSINVSLAQLMKITGFGYWGDGTDVLPIYFSKKYFKHRSEIKKTYL